MFNLTNGFFAIDETELNFQNSIDYVELNLNNKYISNNTHAALKINFNFDFNYSQKIIRFLQTINLYDFFSLYNGNRIMFIISNYSEEVPLALKALLITDLRDRYNFLYDEVFAFLDKEWKKNNPCQFCNSQCIASRNHQSAHKIDGCCYSFEYSRNPFSFSFLKNIHRCKYLGNDKHCLTQNMSCKLFVCNYLKNNSHFNLSYDNFLLLSSFFNKKQALILKHNFFKTREEIIDKLLEKNNLPYILYYIFDYYRIP